MRYITTAALAVLIVCCSVSPGTFDGKGSIRIVVSDAAARTLEPSGDFTVSSYTIRGTGPDGATFEIDTDQSAHAVTALVPGSWAVSAQGISADLEVIAEGTTDVEVLPDLEAEATIVLEDREGAGSLDLSIIWAAGEVGTPSLTGNLNRDGVEEVILSFDITADGLARAIHDDIPTGWYSLVVQILDDGVLFAGGAEATRIAADATTTGELDFSADPDLMGSLDVTIELDLADSLDPVVAGQQAAITPEDEMALETWYESGTVCTWYLDGQILGAGDSASIPPGLSPGGHRADAVHLEQAGDRAGSVSHAFSVTSFVEEGALTPSHLVTENLSGARGIAMDPEGKQVYVAAYDADSICWLLRSEGGLIRPGGSLSGLAALDGPDSVVCTLDGAHVLATGYTADSIVVCTRNAADGSLTHLQSVTGVDGPRGVCVSPEGDHVYVAGHVGDAVHFFTRDPASGLLTWISALCNGEDGISGLDGPVDLVVPPDGQHLYVTGYSSDSVVVFARDSVTGGLTFTLAYQDGDPGFDALNGAHGLAVTPDGGEVLIASYYDRSLTVCHRDPFTGALTPHTVFRDEVEGVDGLYYPRHVILAGSCAYVTGGSDDAVAVFSRNPGTGAWRFLQCSGFHRDGVNVLDSPRGLVAAPDATGVYVCAANTGIVAAYTVYQSAP